VEEIPKSKITNPSEYPGRMEFGIFLARTLKERVYHGLFVTDSG
jgi:hypothetical protein